MQDPQNVLYRIVSLERFHECTADEARTTASADAVHTAAAVDGTYETDGANATDGAKRFVLEYDSSGSFREELYYDTFDAALSRKGLCLTENSRSMNLRDGSTDAVVASAARRHQHKNRKSGKHTEQDVKKSMPTSMRHCGAQNLPDVLRKHIEGLMDGRVLLALGAYARREQNYKLLNEDGKIISRGTFIEIAKRKTASEKNSGKNTVGPEIAVPGIQPPGEDTECEICRFLTAEPLKGYEKASSEAFSEATADGALQLVKPSAGAAENGRKTGSSKEDTPFTRIQELIGFRGKLYTAKPPFYILPRQTLGESFRHICLTLLKVMRQNDEGVEFSLDPEFLHDFRVSVRKTRSAISQISGVLSKKEKKYWSRRFKEIGDITTPVRDADVFLLQEERFSGQFPQHDLSLFFSFLRERRHRDQKELRSYLQSEAYRKLVEEWQERLRDRNNRFNGKHERSRTGKWAGSIIRKKLKRVLSDGEKIRKHAESASDKAFHTLRKDCKKLRYTITFFHEILNPSLAGPLISQLKSLQDLLGEYNDLSVQTRILQDFTNHHCPETHEGLQVSQASGALIEFLGERRQMLRSSFSKEFKHFSSKKNRKHWKKLFSQLRPADTLNSGDTEEGAKGAADSKGDRKGDRKAGGKVDGEVRA
ncbi:MAG: CHAD domain-containing protein [Spirochaetales bacterium]|nr:CHAD domain-containing protein [Spirochaetales bacterium]